MTRERGKLPTTEQLLSPDAIERALEGRDDEEKARAFREHLANHPEADAALDRYRRIGEGKESLLKLPAPQSPAQGAREPVDRADPGGIAVEQPPMSKPQWWLALPVLLLLLVVGFIIWLKADTGDNPVVATAAEPTATAVAVPSTTAPSVPAPADTTPETPPSAEPATTAHVKPAVTAEPSAKVAPPPTATAKSSGGLYFESKE